MLNQTNLDLLGWILLLTGTVILAIFRLNIGDQWLQNRARGVREGFSGSDLDESKQHLFYGLETLAGGRCHFGETDFTRDRTAVSNAALSRREEGILELNEEEFEKVVEFLKKGHRSNSGSNPRFGAMITQFEPIRTNDDVMRLERVEAGYKGVRAAERGVPPLKEYIHAVMEDGSRKIVLTPSYARNIGRSIAKKEQEEEWMRRRRIENWIEDLVKAGALVLVVIGFVLMDPPLEVLKGIVRG